MEKKDSNMKWSRRNSKLVFGLCLLSVLAFSSLFAMNQVKQAEKEKSRLLNEQASLTNEEDFVPRVDEAVQNALEDQNKEALRQSEQEGQEGMEASASDRVEADMAQEDGQKEEQNSEEQAAQTDPDGAEEAQAQQDALEAGTTQILPTVSFSETDSLSWPVAGSVILDYSMDGSIYFPTLAQYKYNPALVIGSDVGAQVVAAARGIVESIDIQEETGTTVTMSLGNGYALKYGQLQELTVAEGDVVEQGELIGYISQPTKYYCVEGSNLYFAMTKDEAPVDPVLYLE